MAKNLKSGYTTGTCAALASKAAAELLLKGTLKSTVSVITPKGVKITVPLKSWKKEDGRAVCAVEKYAGDDPDVTNGVTVYSEVELTRGDAVVIDGGRGVGRVTQKGLQQKIGEAAINRVPRLMIEQAVREVFDSCGYEGGARVVISIPEGEELAKKTFNPRLGIVGGISVLGTSGIVEPMSDSAVRDTISVELKYRRANGAEYAVIAPGNYGMDFLKSELGLDIDSAVKCSNFVGDAIDYTHELGFLGALLVGHCGKFVKLAAGIMNTHSRTADARMEIIAAHSAVCGAGVETAAKIMDCVSTDEAIELVKAAEIADAVLAGIMNRIDYHVKKRADGLRVGVIMFSNVHGILGMTPDAADLLDIIKRDANGEKK